MFFRNLNLWIFFPILYQCANGALKSSLLLSKCLSSLKWIVSPLGNALESIFRIILCKSILKHSKFLLNFCEKSEIFEFLMLLQSIFFKASFILNCSWKCSFEGNFWYCFRLFWPRGIPAVHKVWLFDTFRKVNSKTENRK